MSASLTITYTPQTEGCHRIYFKNGGSEYCEYIDESESVVGQSKQVTIDLDGYNTCINPMPVQITCNSNPDITGYIQPCCTEEGTQENTVSFTAEYDNVICEPYSIECIEEGCKLLFIQLTGDSIPYDEDAPFYPPIVTIESSCGGIGASAYASLTSGVGGSYISFITLDNFGKNYCNLDCITVSITPNKEGDSQKAEAILVSESIECGQFRRKDCIGNPEITNYEVAPGKSTIMCSGGTGPMNVNDSTYTFTKITDGDITCCDCVSYTIYTSLGIDVVYTSCEQTVETIFVPDGETGVTICAVTDTVFPKQIYNDEYILDIVDNGPCS